ncbi:ABC transporter permease [bacterium]|nr:ABC transporter permease [bacterium]
MFFFLKLAFNSVLKNKRSTFTILLVVFICVLTMEFTVGYMDGFKIKLMDDALKQSGHIKIYNQGYYDNFDFAPIDYNLTLSPEDLTRIHNVEGVTSIRPEINFGAMANSETKNQETMVKAIDYTIAGDIYDKRKNNIRQGHFLQADKDVVIGEKMARILELKIDDQVILLTMDQYGGINAVEGKIVGLFKSQIPAENDSLIICSLALAQQLLALENSVTQVTVNIADIWQTETVVKEIEKLSLANSIVIPWQKGQAFLVSILEMMDTWIYVIMGMIIFVAAMGISNSFLMNIMGRLPEFGVLRAMGLSRSQMFGMILSESFILGLLGSILGLIPGVGLVYYFQINPINYEAMGESFESFEGLDAVIGTALVPETAIVVLITGLLISVFAASYPALVAIRKKPVEILRVLQ